VEVGPTVLLKSTGKCEWGSRNARIGHAPTGCGFNYDRLPSRGLFLRQSQGPQSVHVLDGCLTARVLLLKGLANFRFTPLIALKNSFSNISLVTISHKSPSAATKAPIALCQDRKETL
jgi:hypothetical protein